MAREIDSLKLQVSPYCIQQLEQLVSQGVQRMAIQKSGDNPAHVQQAERNLKALVRYFGEYAREQGTFPSLDNTDFDTALNSCPAFWPYRTST